MSASAPSLQSAIVDQTVNNSPKRNTVAHVSSPSVGSPAIDSQAISNRKVKAAANQLLNTGTLPKGFASLLRKFGTDEQKQAIGDSRRARLETFACSKEARRITLAQVSRDVMTANRVSFADYGDGKARLSYAV